MYRTTLELRDDDRHLFEMLDFSQRTWHRWLNRSAT